MRPISPISFFVRGLKASSSGFVEPDFSELKPTGELALSTTITVVILGLLPFHSLSIVGDILQIMAYYKARISTSRRSLKSCPSKLNVKSTLIEVQGA
jgi:hypothetical protein